MSTIQEHGGIPGTTAIRRFTIPQVPEAELQALQARIAATRWPDPRPSRMTRKACRWR
jgi:hypothetical protein